MLRIRIWNFLRCSVGIHCGMVPLSGRESNGKASRFVTRKWCPVCEATTEPRTGPWFVASRRAA